MYLMSIDKYECDYCGTQSKFDEQDDTRGSMWGCEKCNVDFCTKCFVDKCGRDAFEFMLRDGDKVLCPACYENEKGEQNERRKIH